MTRVAAILPCRGRAAQTARNVRRLLATAGDVPGGWRLTCVVGGEPDVYDVVKQTGVDMLFTPHRLTYWQALARETADRPDAPLLVNLANDLLPGAQWLARAVQAYDASGGRFPVLGFNDGISCTAHFLIARAWLDTMGGWPVWYDHMYGDTEIVARATAAGAYGVAWRAVLYHDHEMTGAPGDAVYEEGKARWDADRALFARRRAEGWPRAS